MGRKKIDTTKEITLQKKRNQTLLKRKRGLIKKAMELATLCGQNMSIVIQDKKNTARVTLYQSSEQFTIDDAAYVVKNTQGVEHIIGTE